MNKIEEMNKLNERLLEAARVYYQESSEIMSNYEYDRLYDKLLELEKETGIVLSNSITQKVGYEIISDLPKKKHPSKMLSLDKTKSRTNLVDWLKGKDGCLSYKLDGNTVVLTYENGELVEAITRGNGEVGEVITPNARFFRGVPKKIPFKYRLVLRGEALMTYENFEKVNSKLGDTEAKYKNPRNLASGTIRQLDTKITAERGIDFYAFTLVEAEKFFEKDLLFNGEMENGSLMSLYSDQLDWLASLGFQVVPHKVISPSNLISEIEKIESSLDKNTFPSDGLVLFYNDVEYGRRLGNTAKFPRNGIAFKWADETAKTILREIEWSASRTGLLNPVAIFDSVELEGTTVSRASVHNLSIIKDLQLNIGDEIEVYKANMIIPQIAKNHTKSLKSISEVIPNHCPICGGITKIQKQKDSETLICTNPDCMAKHVGKFEHFVSRDAMNIIGVSTAMILDLINIGALARLIDFYFLEVCRDEIIALDGWGEKSYNKMMKAIKDSKKVDFHKFIYALGIPNIGVSTAKIISKHFDYNLKKISQADVSKFEQIDGIGSVLAQNIFQFFQEKRNMIFELAEQMDFIIPKETSDKKFENITFVITGSLEQFPNRNALKDVIEERGGKVSGSVSKKTNYLINNDTASLSGKNKKAKELSIPVISETDFLNLLND